MAVAHIEPRRKLFCRMVNGIVVRASIAGVKQKACCIVKVDNTRAFIHNENRGKQALKDGEIPVFLIRHRTIALLEHPERTFVFDGVPLHAKADFKTVKKSVDMLC